MSLNVKDPEAHRLAQAIAQATGETMTRAVTEALRERYERLQRRDPETLATDIRAIAKRAAATSSVRIWIMLSSCTTNTAFPNDLDSSQLVAILAEEPDAELYTRAAMLFGRAFEHAVAALFRREDPAAVLFEQWGVCKNMGLTYAGNDTWDRMLQQGVSQSAGDTSASESCGGSKKFVCCGLCSVLIFNMCST
jgi:antitoxin VapB